MTIALPMPERADHLNYRIDGGGVSGLVSDDEHVLGSSLIKVRSYLAQRCLSVCWDEERDRYSFYSRHGVTVRSAGIWMETVCGSPCLL
ncbi:hypothetical protein ACWGLB_11420 [Streptomyces sp. NPDC055893]